MKGKFEDMTGRRFGRLVILEELHKNKVRCQCDCGNEVIVNKTQIINGNTQSCGCFNREISASALAALSSDGGKCFIGRLKSNKPSSRNRSGVKGVSWDKSRSKWVAELKIRGKKIFLGRFDELDTAAAARKKAEELYFKPIIDKGGK